MPDMTRWGDWNAKGREAWEESQRLYKSGPSPYAVEYQRRYCCAECKREIKGMQGCFYQASTGKWWHVGCYLDSAEFKISLDQQDSQR